MHSRIDDLHLFDGMSLSKKCNRTMVPARAGAGGIDALPEGVLHHILGFMDAREAVQTSVLARRWHHLWKSATAVRIDWTHLPGVLNFMGHLLLLRGGSRFDTFYLNFLDFKDDNVRHVNFWIRYALQCKVQELTFGFPIRSFPLNDLPLVSHT